MHIGLSELIDFIQLRHLDMLNWTHAICLLYCALSFAGIRSPPFSVHAVKRTWLPVWRKAWACACTTCLRSRCSTGVRSAAMVTWRRAKSATAGSPRWDRGQNALSLLLLFTREPAGGTWMCRGLRKKTYFYRKKVWGITTILSLGKWRLGVDKEHVKLWVRQYAARVQNKHLTPLTPGTRDGQGSDRLKREKTGRSSLWPNCSNKPHAHTCALLNENHLLMMCLSLGSGQLQMSK